MEPEENGTPTRPAVRAGAAYVGGSHIIAEARDFTADFLSRARAADVMVGPLLVERARLVVSELMTNAVKYADGPVSILLEVREDALVIAVSDTAPALPVPKAYDPGRIGQHGLEIVQALCRDLRITEQTGGKRITAYIGLN